LLALIFHRGLLEPSEAPPLRGFHQRMPSSNELISLHSGVSTSCCSLEETRGRVQNWIVS
jgi:hypothetical protein